MYRIAGHTMGTPEYTLIRALELFKAIGLDGAEIVVQDGYQSGIPLKAGKQELTAIREAAHDQGLEIVCLTPYFCRFNDPDPQIREQETEGIKRVLDYAVYLGARYIRIYGGNAQCPDDMQGDRRRYMIESMQTLGEAAQQAGKDLVIENHFNTMTVSAADTIRLIREIGHPCVNILYDQANLDFMGKESYGEAIGLQGEQIHYVHVKDHIYKKHTAECTASKDVSHQTEEERNVTTRIVGEGILPWPDILQALRSAGYEGWLSLEYERRWHAMDIPDASIGMKQSARYLRSYIQNLK
ncbi:sugar phosphate isomerase/epimerase family protein [Diplocloster hominis]|uniref:sugar phosphate isomerase/epimerase family protein n=1 Tax=Diplocloster hominis TaxID=3079010 RepID=UPI0031B9E42A